MTDALDLSVVVRARLELEARRIDAVERMREDGRAAELVDRLAGDRLRAIVQGQRSLFARDDPSKISFEKLADLQRSTDRVSSEGLALALGALARDSGLDGGACEQADRFVVWLAGKADRRLARMSVPGDDDAVHRATDVIHRRLPDHGIWDLPILAHEFGHLVAAGLSAWDASGNVINMPVVSALQGLDGSARSQAVELFCDLFATYSLGPSFLCTEVFHRLDPSAGPVAPIGASHPSDSSRVLAVQLILLKMRGGTSSHGFDTQMYWAGLAWQQMQSQASVEAVMSQAQQAMLMTRVAEWWATLTSDLSGFAYSWSPTIQQLVAHIRSADADPPTGFSPADVLNAAWIVRLGTWFEKRPADRSYERRAEALLDASLAAEGTHD